MYILVKIDLHEIMCLNSLRILLRLVIIRIMIELLHAGCNLGSNDYIGSSLLPIYFEGNWDL